MRSIYLIIFFITATVFFFYFVNSLTLTVNLSGIETAPAAADNPITKIAPVIINATGTKTFTPSNFGGPTGQPHIIGPTGPPPNY